MLGVEKPLLFDYDEEGLSEDSFMSINALIKFIESECMLHGGDKLVLTYQYGLLDPENCHLFSSFTNFNKTNLV